ncbi:MAG: oxygen-independent coproporphyrinogen III oxidase [Sphingobacteriaceae bacterium]|nr:oxygen-independent coproporphyrinogen III oxidase [Sphingobacteriaceae bacterium]
MESSPLFERYNTSIPRYTSYPTVPHWEAWQHTQEWQVQLALQATKAKDGIAIYIHLPYCEHLCTYCGCNKKITNNHRVESPYIDRLLKEWMLYVQAFKGHAITISELHLGGGTPTFFAPEQLRRLMEGIFAQATPHPQLEMSFEGHPNNTTLEHLQVLRQLGFNRVSFGVQDLDVEVQRLIARIQPLENLVEVTENARKLGYNSVNYDLIYGLPLQTPEKLANTLREVIALRPDRVAFYGYAHVPWKSRSQRLYDKSHLPSPAERMALYEQGRETFLAAGYEDVGMDHFALPNDSLLKALHNKRLHRNFMGYTSNATPLLIGLGVSAISDLGTAFGQNSKEIALWERMIDDQEFPVDKGLVLSQDDRLRQKLILDMSCQGSVNLPADWNFDSHQLRMLQQMEEDGLLEKQQNRLQLTPTGKLFTRHACSLFDAYWVPDGTSSLKRFSQAV